MFSKKIDFDFVFNNDETETNVKKWFDFNNAVILTANVYNDEEYENEYAVMFVKPGTTFDPDKSKVEIFYDWEEFLDEDYLDHLNDVETNIAFRVYVDSSSMVDYDWGN